MKFIQLEDGSKVTVGRDVHLWVSRFAPERLLPQPGELQCVAAKVVALNTDGSVRLYYWAWAPGAEAGYMNAFWAPEPREGHWTWPERV